MADRRDINKVHLINPPGRVFVYPDGTPAHRKHCTPPLGLAYLAAVLLQHDYRVEATDMVAEGYNQEVVESTFIRYGLSDEEMIARLEASQPDLVGISVLFSNIYPEVKTLVAKIKARFPDLPIVLGGHHPTGAPSAVMADPNVDYVMTGEADLNFYHFLEALNGRAELAQVRGLYYRQDGAVRSTMEDVAPIAQGGDWKYFGRKDAGVPLELDELPLPAWHILPMETYWNVDVRIGGGDVVKDRFCVMMSTRGCPHVCYFCTSPLMSAHKGYRRRSNDGVLAEIRWLRDQFGVQEIQFLDDNFYVSKPRVKKLLRDIAREFPDMIFSVPGGTEANALDDEVIELMAEANFYKVLLSIEAADPKLQAELIDKKVRVHEVPRTVAKLKQHGIETRAIFMIGFPGEKRSQIDVTVEMAKTLDADDFYLSIVTALPGTPLYDECVEKGLFIEGYDPNNIRFSHANIRLPDTTPEELEDIRRSVWKTAFENRRAAMKVIHDDRRTKFTDITHYETVGYAALSAGQPASTEAEE